MLCADTWTATEADSDEESEEEEYTVEAILDERKVQGITQYLVQWEGWDDATTWEPASNFHEGNAVLAEYLE